MQLHWFRTDLRIHDNTALYHAASSGSVVSLYIITPKQWQQHDDAACKIDFWRRQLVELAQDLNRLNIPLLIASCENWQAAPEVLLNICQQYGVSQLHYNQEYAVNERNRDQAVQQLLGQHGIKVQSYLDQLLFEPGSIKTKNGDFFKVFGQFKKACQQRLYARLPEVLPAIKPQQRLPLQSDPIPAYIEGFEFNSPSIQTLWPVAEQQAWQRLDTFVDNSILSYDQQRDFPALKGTSQLSAYLTAGIISIRQCLQAAIKAADGELFAANEGINTWINELLWREFYQHIVVGYPQVSRHQPFKPKTRYLCWRQAPDDLTRWQQGHTGFPIIDAAMRQLLHTGWMHNRLRMIVAMFLSKNLLIDWRLGEQWFMQHLIDGELAANNGGWQWCASTGTDSVPYFRIFNPITQSQKIDPEGKFIRQWLPELAQLDNKAIHAPHLAKKVDYAQLNYPKPMLDLALSRRRALEAFNSLSGE